MPKTNDRKKRRDGTIPSHSIKLPSPLKSFNCKTSDYSYPDSEKIEGKSFRHY